MSGGEPPTVLDCTRLVKRYATPPGGFELRLERLVVRAGELLLLHSASGSGKSTLLDLVAMILRPSSVDLLRLMDRNRTMQDVAALWQRSAINRMDRLRGECIGYVLQSGGLLPFLTVRRNIELGARLAGREHPGDLARTLAQRLGIQSQLEKLPEALSIGERQRVAIARALAPGPRLLLADEPTASLDAINGAEVTAMLAEQAKNAGTAVLLASHGEPAGLPAGSRQLSHRLLRRDGWVYSQFSD